MLEDAERISKLKEALEAENVKRQKKSFST